MNAVAPTPTPPPRWRWLQALLVAVAAVYLGCALAFPNDSFTFGHLAVLSLAPLALLLLTWRKWRGPVCEPAEAGRLRFRRFWMWVWLVAALAATLLLTFGKPLRGESATALRLATALLVLWTTLLVVLLWLSLRTLGGREFWRVALRQSPFAAAVLATLIALFYAEENWRGRSQWERFRTEWEAKGVKFSIADILPPPVPDDQNMAMHPLFKPLLDYTFDAEGRPTWRDTNGMDRLRKITARTPELWEPLVHKSPQPDLPSFTISGFYSRTSSVVLADLTRWQDFYRLDTNFAATPPAATPALEVLRYLARHELALAELDEALARPHSQFRVEMTEDRLPSETPLPHLEIFKGIVPLLVLRATARLEAGQPDDALRDIERAWQLCASLGGESFALVQLVRVALQAITLGAVAHGTAGHHWEDRHLRRLEDLIRPINVLMSWQSGTRGEIAFVVDYFIRLERSRELAVREVTSLLAEPTVRDSERFEQNWEWLNRRCVRYAPAGWYFQSLLREEVVITELLGNGFVDVNRRLVHWKNQPAPPRELWFDRFCPFRDVSSGFSYFAAKCARLQTNLDHGRLACALERHWLRHRAYPEKLDALVPEFLDRIPHDIFDGQPMRYRREGEQGFVLWSIGFDGKDDNAGPLHFAGNQGGSVGEESGDLVWRYPQTP